MTDGKRHRMARDKVRAQAETDNVEDDPSMPVKPRKVPRDRAVSTRGKAPARQTPAAAKDRAATAPSADRPAPGASRRRVAAPRPNPRWWVPTMVTLFIVGLLYLVVYYLSTGAYPLPIGDWNLIVGFGILILGFAMTMRWR
ncbi:cell division protein CrgA [Devriesea agamarum]|uniref:cell division protein CrgA n=1 Tax=Devriesea agamarum TaxID=472569 RepID=UPI001E333147|nr:cell division protein CrgA [Devriesea agamarum]